MTLFPREMESERLGYERLHPADFDPLELYEYAREGAPHLDELTDHVAGSPYGHPNQAFGWVERCGERFVEGQPGRHRRRVVPGINPGSSS